jgi:hypothetical protein
LIKLSPSPLIKEKAAKGVEASLEASTQMETAVHGAWESKDTVHRGGDARWPLTALRLYKVRIRETCS